MTDLVAQLVGALQDCLDRIEKSEFWWMDCPDRGGFDAETIRAALSEAKAGGWVTVQGEPVAWMNDEGDVELSHKPWMSSVWTPLYALPNPPKGEV